MRFSTVYALLLSATSSMALSVPLDRRQESGGCKKITLLYARGTGEGGTMGSSVGPRFSNALGEKFGKDNVKTDGVAYPADVNGATSGAINPKGSPGAKAMADMVKNAFKSCPRTNVVLSGYSQGAEQVHGALMNLGAEGTKVTVCTTLLFYTPFHVSQKNKALTYARTEGGRYLWRPIEEFRYLGLPSQSAFVDKLRSRRWCLWRKVFHLGSPYGIPEKW
jgi:hypothetical protein